MSESFKKIISKLFSYKTTILLLLLLSSIIAIATFIENKHDTFTAKVIIYDAKWFEVILSLLVVNLLGSIIKNKLFNRKKPGFLLTHFALVIMIIGASITRYFGFEADMHIREGESSNIIYSSDPYLQLKENTTEFYYCSDKPVYFSQIGNRSKWLRIKYENKTIEVNLKNYIRSAKEVIIPHIGEKNVIELSLAKKNGIVETVYINKGSYKNLGNIIVSYDNNSISNSINIIEQNNELLIQSPYPVRVNKKTEYESQIIDQDSVGNFNEDFVYNINGELFLFVEHHKNAKIIWTQGNPNKNFVDVLIAEIQVDNFSEEIELFYNNEKYIQKPANVSINANNYEITYGPKPTGIPFSIELNDFILKKYPGSENPSSYLSHVTLIDNRTNLKEKHTISKNNVLDYDGYRFFQTLYDDDEKGTILSVNHDFYGTLISYIGYFILGLGFIVLLFSKNSRFNKLSKEIKKIRLQRKKLLTILLFFISINGFGFNNFSQSNVNKEHAEQFGKLLVQTYDGRFAPVSTLAYDVMHKISKKDNIILPQNERMDAMHVFLDMLHNPEFWKQQEIIYMGDASVRKVIGITNKYVSFNSFFNQQNRYKLEQHLQAAFNKKPKDQTRFDKEVIKVTERVNICIMTFNGSLLKIFPLQNSKNNTWISWTDSRAKLTLNSDSLLNTNTTLLPVYNYKNLMQLYLTSAIEANKTENYSRPNQILKEIKNIQKQSAYDFLPSEFKVRVEVFYNKANIFSLLKYTYLLLGFCLLVLSLIQDFYNSKNKSILILIKVFVALLVSAFAYHTFGMGLRWFLTNHAPWSNGYETLLLVAWGCLLAGFGFFKNSKLTFAATAILSFLILMTAGHSNYDPQLTNLQPVLKSYWLIFHVATITIGYGFLALGFFLGIINLILRLFKSLKNKLKSELLIKELTYINEKALYIGLFLTTIGTFLGGVWANESWGRYWGWDPKETWSLIIIIVYAIILHFRLIPKMKSALIFNIGSIIAFGSVIMTFIGLNYYFRKGLHSYATGDPPVFPVWAWVIILLLFALISLAIIKEKVYKIKDS